MRLLIGRRFLVAFALAFALVIANAIISYRAINTLVEANACALTGYVSADDRERVFAAGFQAHLPKPINIEYLSAVILTVSRIKSEPRPAVNIDEF